MTNLNTEPKSALILIEYQNDWLARTGSINPQFQDREQVETPITNAAKVLAEARRRDMEVIHVIMVLEPTYRSLGKAKYGLRAMIPAYGSAPTRLRCARKMKEESDEDAAPFADYDVDDDD